MLAMMRAHDRAVGISVNRGELGLSVPGVFDVVRAGAEDTAAAVENRLSVRP